MVSDALTAEPSGCSTGRSSPGPAMSSPATNRRGISGRDSCSSTTTRCEIRSRPAYGIGDKIRKLPYTSDAAFRRRRGHPRRASGSGMRRACSSWWPSRGMTPGRASTSCCTRWLACGAGARGSVRVWSGAARSSPSTAGWLPGCGSTMLRRWWGRCLTPIHTSRAPTSSCSRRSRRAAGHCPSWKRCRPASRSLPRASTAFPRT